MGTAEHLGAQSAARAGWGAPFPRAIQKPSDTDHLELVLRGFLRRGPRRWLCGRQVHGKEKNSPAAPPQAAWSPHGPQSVRWGPLRYKGLSEAWASPVRGASVLQLTLVSLWHALCSHPPCSLPHFPSLWPPCPAHSEVALSPRPPFPAKTQRIHT